MNTNKEARIVRLINDIKIAVYKENSILASEYLAELESLESGTARVLHVRIITQMLSGSPSMYLTLPAVKDFEKCATLKECGELNRWITPRFKKEDNKLETQLEKIGPMYWELREEKRLRDFCIIACVLMTFFALAEFLCLFDDHCSAYIVLFQIITGAVSVYGAIKQTIRIRMYKKIKNVYKIIINQLVAEKKAYRRFAKLYDRLFKEAAAK